MTLTIKAFSSQDIRNTPGPDEYLVQMSYATKVAFCDESFGCLGYDDTILNQCVLSGETVEKTATLTSCRSFALEVLADAYGEFSIHDGANWRGPFSVVGCVPYGMLVRAPAGSAPTFLVRFKAIHVSNRVLIRAHNAVSPEQLAVLGAMP